MMKTKTSSTCISNNNWNKGLILVSQWNNELYSLFKKFTVVHLSVGIEVGHVANFRKKQQKYTV